MATKKKRMVIVRAHTAGVHFGEFVSRKGDTVILKNSRRLWQWHGGSLSQVATTGPSNAGTNKFGATVLQTEIVSPQGYEIMDCSAEAVKAILAMPDWKV